MKFLNKKIFLLGIIIVIFIIVTGIVAVFYWQKTDIPENTPQDISQEAVKAKCFEDVNKMTDDELINEIKNLKYPEEKLVSGESRINYAYKNIINYFICKIGDTKNEDDYNLYKNFINELTIQEKNKEIFLNRLDKVYFYDILENSFILQLALMNLDEICPNKLVDLCIIEIDQFSEEKKSDIEICKDVCNLINQYSEDYDKLETEIINYKTWFDNELLYNQALYKYRSAMAYRLKGQDLAIKVCDNVDISEKENCINWVYILNDKKKIFEEGCSNSREELEELICQL